MDFSGAWYNELNSTMIIDMQPNGRLEGTYQTGVGGAPELPLTGMFDVVSEFNPAVGWVVNWDGDSSLTS